VDAYTSKEAQSWGGREDVRQPRRTPLSAYVSIRQHTSAYVSIRGCEAAEEDASISIRQHTSAYEDVRQPRRTPLSLRRRRRGRRMHLFLSLSEDY
jgi:hypothetical protein